MDSSNQMIDIQTLLWIKLIREKIYSMVKKKQDQLLNFPLLNNHHQNEVFSYREVLTQQNTCIKPQQSNYNDNTPMRQFKELIENSDTKLDYSPINPNNDRSQCNNQLNQINSTFHSMCSELPHSTQKMFLSIENQIKDRQFLNQIVYGTDNSVRNQELEISLKDQQDLLYQRRDNPNEIQEKNKNLRLLCLENDQLKQNINENEFQYKRLKTENEELKQEKNILNQQIELQLNTQIMYGKNEDGLRKKIDTLHKQINEQEKLMRSKEEEIFQLNSEKMNFLCEIKNLQLHDQNMKHENSMLNQKRCELEDAINDLKSQLYTLQNLSRSQESQIEILNREKQQFQHQQNIFISDLEELRMQNINERQFMKEKEIQIQCKLNKQELDQKALENENKQLNILVDQLHQSLNTQGTQMILEKKQQVQFQERKQSIQTDYMKMRQDYIDAQNTSAIKSRDQSSNKKDQYNLNDEKQQEDHQAWWPQGVIKTSQLQVQSQTNLKKPPQNPSHVQSQDFSVFSNSILQTNKSQGVLNSQTYSLNQDQKKQPANLNAQVSWVSQNNNKENSQLFKQRNNASQLSNVFSWNDQDQQTPQTSKNDYTDQTQKNQQNQNASLTYREVNSKQQQRNSYQELENGYQTVIQNQKLQQIQEFNQQLNMKNKKEKLQESNTQRVTFPSNQQYLDHKDVIIKLEQQLQSFQFEKQKLEVEFSKMPTKSINTIALKKKKETLEFDIEINTKNINTVKQKLRDLNVL
eukprot:403361847